MNNLDVGRVKKLKKMEFVLRPDGMYLLVYKSMHDKKPVGKLDFNEVLDFSSSIIEDIMEAVDIDNIKIPVMQ